MCVVFSCCDLTRSSLPRAERHGSYAIGKKCAHVTGGNLRPAGLAAHYLAAFHVNYSGNAIIHTCQLSGFWTESPSFSSHQNPRPREIKMSVF